VEPVGGAICAPSKDLWETPVCGVFHRSGRIHGPVFEISSPQEAPGATIGEPIDLGHPPNSRWPCRHDVLRSAPRRRPLARKLSPVITI